MITINQQKELEENISKIKSRFNINKLNNDYTELEIRSQSPEFWNDSIIAKNQLKELNKLKNNINIYNKILNGYDELLLAIDYLNSEIIKESEIDDIYDHLIEDINKFLLLNALNEPEDNMDCIIKINSGAGGTESQDWAQMLMRMYCAWADRNKYKVSISDIQLADIGIKNVTILIENQNNSTQAYGKLKGENGIHRLIRVSPYNAQGKRMTSFASVFVTPLVDDTIKIDIDKSKLTWDTFRSGGAGGQNVNKVETGVRLHYIYTDPETNEENEISIENTETRSQNDNRNRALQLLKSKLYNIELELRKKKQSEIEKNKKKIEWGNQIRSYIFDQSLVKDHRTGFQDTDVISVMNGHIDDFLMDYQMILK